MPGKPKKFQGEFYSMSEIEAISTCVGNLEDIEDKKKIQDRMRAVAVISVAAFAGLRLAEIRGLRWSDYDGQSLAIRRAVWRTHVGDTKNPTSAGTVPVLPVLKKILDDHHARVIAGKKHCGPDDYIFAGERRGAPLNLANMVRRVILPALAENEDEILYWKGWHAFRRALATNLHSCGVDPKVAQAIFRHSDMRTTLEFYTMVPDADARAALQKIEKWITEI